MAAELSQCRSVRTPRFRGQIGTEVQSMARFAGTRTTTFFRNWLCCPQARTTKIVWAAIVLLIVNLVYVNKDVWVATGTEQFHGSFSKNQDLFHAIRQKEMGANSGERTSEEHTKPVSSLGLDEDMSKAKTNKSLKPDRLAVNESMRSGNHLEQNEIAVNESRIPDGNLNLDKRDLEKKAQTDHEHMSDKHVVGEQGEAGDDPQQDDTVNDTIQIPDDVALGGHTKQGRRPSGSLKTDKKKANEDTQTESVEDERIAVLKNLLFGPPKEVVPTVFDVCLKACRARTRSNISKELPFMKVKRLDIDPISVSLDDPPIPIIGTDKVHQRIVSGVDIAEFMAHVTMWRRVFHGSGGIGVFIGCEVRDAVPLLKTLRKDEWFRNETEGGVMGNETWDILLLGAGRPGAVPGGSIGTRVVSQIRIEDDDMFGYALSQKGANELLRHVRAFTVPTREFMSAVMGRGLKVLRWDGAGLGDVRACTGSKGEQKDSALLPFYPPVHWIHAAARDRQR